MKGRTHQGRWEVEWYIFEKPRFHISFGTREGFDIFVHISLILFTIYISYETQTFRNQGEFRFYWHEYGLWLIFWDDNGYQRTWWNKAHNLDFKELIMGKPKYTLVKGESFDCYIPMYEGTYKAQATIEERTWKYRFGYLIYRKSYWITIPGGIPFAGKGENSWDCGDDALMSTGGETLEAAIANCVKCVLERRKEYGYDSKETGKVPLNVIESPIGKD